MALADHKQHWNILCQKLVFLKVIEKIILRIQKGEIVFLFIQKVSFLLFFFSMETNENRFCKQTAFPMYLQTPLICPSQSQIQTPSTALFNLYRKLKLKL